MQQLATEVKHALGLQALVVVPGNRHTSSSEHSSNPIVGGKTAAPPCGQLTFDRPLQLHPRGDLGEQAFELGPGASGADCVLVAVDQAAGLAQALSLAPVLVVVGVARAPALSSDMDQHPAVAVGRQAALLGLPTVAACLAATSPGAPLQPAVAATAALLGRLLPLLQRGRSWPCPSNFPRAHFPFPERGRWALGSQLPLPDSRSAGTDGGGGSGSGSSNYDCWALGDDNSWLGEYNSSRGSRSSGKGGSDSHGKQEAYQLLQGAFADGDVLLCLNVPPTWTAASGFAASRPGVLWHCWQVAAEHQQQQQQQQGGWCEAPRHSSSSSTTVAHSWQVDRHDLWGRTLPSTSYGSSVPSGDCFVGQDNTAKVAAERTFGLEGSSSGGGGFWDHQQPRAGSPATAQLPRSFTIQRGTLLNDAAACGDVEAVFSGKAALSLVQTWPAGHPLSLRDELLLAALDETPEGLPAWIS